MSARNPAASLEGDWVDALGDALKDLVGTRESWDSPADLAVALDRSFVVRDHLRYLSDRLAEAVAAVEAGESRYLLVSMPPRLGKQVADREPVLTTEGWRRHGDLRVGDRVFSPSGEAVPVLAVSEPSNEKVRVSFTDGSEVTVHPDHEWTVYDRTRGAWRTVETRYLMGRVLWPKGRRSERGSRALFQLPPVSPLQMPDKDLPVEPYTLGAWLGDGAVRKGVICGAREDLDAILEHVPYERGARHVHAQTGVHYQTLKGGLRGALREAGVFEDKRIPEAYLTASEAQRRSLLAGIVDTDGTVGKDCRVTVCTSSLRLAEDLRLLVRTLGYRAGLHLRPADTRDRTLNGHRIRGGEYWQVSWTPHDGEPQGRALERKTRTKVSVKRRVAVASIEPAPDEPGRCIQVEGGLYLVGDGLTPTHNSFLTSVHFVLWVLHKHPEWETMLLSHAPDLASMWGRQVRRAIEENPRLGLRIAHDQGAVTDWATVEGGGVLSKSIRQSVTGRGAKVMVLDDVVKDFADAHSESSRRFVWDWWTANSRTRLHPPALVVVIGTRWHEDDLIGRMRSPEYEGDPDQWEVISFPAIAEADDVLGRTVGEPLLSPIVDETAAEALARWADIRQAVGTYAWTALYQQSPSPSQGSIFVNDWWRFWRPEDLVGLEFGRRITSWDCAFKGTDDSDFVVGQEWAVHGADRYLLRQVRGRWTFTETLEQMERFIADSGAHEHVVEDKANGTAVVDVLKAKVPGMVPVNPTDSKEARARSVTPEVESGNVYLPALAEWLPDLLGEAKAFPNGAHDDQVDALTQALTRLRVPGQVLTLVPQASVTRGYRGSQGHRPGSFASSAGRRRT